MLCAIYKSKRKAGMYLYVAKRDGFADVPEALLAQFGQPIFVMMFNLDGEKSLAQCDKEKVRAEILQKGFYLFMPPVEENLFTKWVNENKNKTA